MNKKNKLIEILKTKKKNDRVYLKYTNRLDHIKYQWFETFDDAFNRADDLDLHRYCVTDIKTGKKFKRKCY